MFAEVELRPTNEELGQWYYEGIDEGGCLYFDHDLAETFDSPSPSSYPTPVRSTHVPSLLDMEVVRPSEMVATDTEIQEEVLVRQTCVRVRLMVREDARGCTNEHTERQSLV
ncbi:hypothetical protein LWI29_033767 [Acer saccharum]|uniref:Uncharacterized protein n=1 Tax=Acer saccharum TaxID=4024 RepID=A0AA39RS68_ACESA|nr:hypothetical protein LWI29_033767 [Acer saccharum]